MCRFLETIKLHEGTFYRPDLHQQRVNDTFAEYFPDSAPIDIVRYLNQLAFPSQGLIKCRIVYDSQMQLVEFIEYKIRPVSSLKLIVTTIPYSQFKSEDRKLYDEAFALRNGADDVLLVRDGFVTDTSYCNIALFDGNEWLTPRRPLLTGTQRKNLLERKILKEADIRSEELQNFTKIRLFNAMIEFGELELSVNQIHK